MKRVRILVDQDPMDPRVGVGRMICWHDRYNLGDNHDYDCDEFMRELAFEACNGLEERIDYLEGGVYDRLSDFVNWERASQLIDAKVDELVEKVVRDGYIMLPLYLYDHSSITMSTGPFSCVQDSCQVGWIICDNETIKREFNGDRDLAEKCLKAEVSTYDEYLTGNVYGFIVEEGNDDDGWEETDSCWGFFGSDVRTNGMADHLDVDLIELAANADFEYH